MYCGCGCCEVSCWTSGLAFGPERVYQEDPITGALGSPSLDYFFRCAWIHHIQVDAAIIIPLGMAAALASVFP